MKPKYNIAPKPTVYKDILYRSRLEANWACFFDKVGWEYEYEPFDLKGWSPDFILHTQITGSLLVEVKPRFLVNRELELKLAKASGNSLELVILTENPFSDPDWFKGTCGTMPRYIDDEVDDYCSASIVPVAGKYGIYNICSSDSGIHDLAADQPDIYRRWWNQAKNETTFLKPSIA